MVDRDGAAAADLLELVGEVYDAAIEPSKWPAALQRVANVLGGKSVAITLNSTAKPGFAMRAQWNVDAELEAAMAANYNINPLLSALYYYGVDEPFSVLTYLDEVELRRTEFYRNTLGRHGICDSAVCLLAKSSSEFGSISIQREETMSPFGEAEFATMRRLVPHIRRAAFIGELLEARAVERNMLAATLDALTVGVVLTDGTARIVHQNEAAARMIEARGVFHRDPSVLIARHPDSARELAEAIASAASGTTLDVPRAGIVVSLRSEQGTDLAAWVLPLDSGLRRDLGAEFSARAAVFIRELGDNSPVPAELFVRRYGITPAECRVLLLIVQGRTPQEAADALGITLATAKTHIARLLEKTETKRQVDLVRLAMSVLAPASR